MPDLSPASSTGRLQLPLTAPNPRAIVLPDTRPPETQRLSLCKGKAEREPAVTGGLVSHDQDKRSHASPVRVRDVGTGSKRAAIRVAWSACRDLPALGSQLRKLTLQRQQQPVTGAAGLAGRPGAGPPGYPASRPRDPMFAVPSQADSIASYSASQPPARRQSLRDSGCTRRQLRSLGAAGKLASSWKAAQVRTGPPLRSVQVA